MLVLWNYLVALKARFGNEKGASAVEYTLLLVLIAVILIGVVTLVGQELSDVWQGILNALTGLEPEG
jgi:pilus assembly protein Flp/PilA